VSYNVGDGCTPKDVIAFAGGGGGGGDGDINGPGGTGGGADTRGNDGSGSGTSRAGKSGSPGTDSAGGAGGAGGSVFDITCFCTTNGEAGTAGQSAFLPTTQSQYSATGQGRQTGGVGGQEYTGGILLQQTWGGSGGAGYNGGGGGGASHGFSSELDGSGPLAGAGSGGGGGGSSTPIGAATPSRVLRGAGTNTLAIVSVQARWATTTTVTSSSNPAQPGQPVTLTATLATVNPFGTRQLTGGTVTFDDVGAAQSNGSNGTRLGSAPVVVGPDGRVTATLTVPSLTGGDHRTRVRFGGYSPFRVEAGSFDVLPSIGFVNQVVVSQQTLSFTSAPGPRAAYGDAYTPSVGSTSGLPVTVTVDPSAAAVCGIDPATAPQVSFFSAGTCVLNADQAGSPAFFAAPRLQQSFTVAAGTPPVQQVITFTSTPPANPVRGSFYTVSAVGGRLGQPGDLPGPGHVELWRVLPRGVQPGPHRRRGAVPYHRLAGRRNRFLRRVGDAGPLRRARGPGHRVPHHPALEPAGREHLHGGGRGGLGTPGHLRHRSGEHRLHRGAGGVHQRR